MKIDDLIATSCVAEMRDGSDWEPLHNTLRARRITDALREFEPILIYIARDLRAGRWLAYDCAEHVSQDHFRTWCETVGLMWSDD